MSKYKNFDIERNEVNTKVLVSALSVGELFEREGALHMKVFMPHAGLDNTSNQLTVCNLTTGSSWRLFKDEEVSVVQRSKISYTVEK